MKVTQTIELEDNERLAIQKVLEICDEISDIAHCSMVGVFEYLTDVADVIGDYKYSIGDTLYIAKMG
jgi:hypothetical protein